MNLPVGNLRISVILCYTTVLNRKYTKCIQAVKCCPIECSFSSTMTSFSDRTFKECWTDSGECCLHWQLARFSNCQACKPWYLSFAVCTVHFTALYDVLFSFFYPYILASKWSLPVSVKLPRHGKTFMEWCMNCTRCRLWLECVHSVKGFKNDIHIVNSKIVYAFVIYLQHANNFLLHVYW